MSLTRAEIEAELIKRGALPATSDSSGASAAPNTPNDGGLLQNGDTSNSFGFMSHPIANTMKAVHGVQDVAGGLMGGAQRFGASLGQAVEYPVHAGYEALTGNKVPHYNVREMFGLAGENPVDLNQEISHNPDSFMSKMGQFAPAIAAGGANLGRQAVANGLWGAVQADPDQQNLGGYLPNGRLGAGIEDAATAATLGAAGKYGPGLIVKAGQQIKKGMNYLSPDKDAAEFLKTLGSGTKEENVKSLAQDIQNAHEARLQDALSHKTPVYEQEGKSKIYDTPTSALPEGNLDKVAYYIAPGQKAKPEQLDALAQEIKNYRAGKVGKDPYDFEDFTHNVQGIFKSDMNQAQIDNLEHALSVPTEAPTNFLNLVKNNPNLINGKTQDLFDIFNRRRTLDNADKLQSQLGAQMGKYSDKAEKSGLTPGEDLELQKLKEMRDTLKSDMQGHLTRKNPKLAEENQKFIDKYRENVTPYGEKKVTQDITNEPNYVREARSDNPNLSYNVTGGQMHEFFSEPSRAAQQIAGDIGQTGRNKVLYNLLADETNPKAKGLANAILNAKQSKGYSTYITPEIENLALSLLKRVKLRERTGATAKWGTGGLAGVGGAYELYKGLNK
jgi:hypothetical protein